MHVSQSSPLLVAYVPTANISLHQPADVIPQRLARSQQRHQFGTSRADNWSTLVNDAGDLIEVATDGAELADSAIKQRSLLLQQRCKRSEMAPNNHGSSRKPPRGGALTQLKPITR